MNKIGPSRAVRGRPAAVRPLIGGSWPVATRDANVRRGPRGDGHPDRGCETVDRGSETAIRSMTV